MSMRVRGTHTTIEKLAQRLLRRWVPKWHEAFTDKLPGGGFYERLGHSFKPVKTAPPRRLLTQCRQLAMYADASTRDGGRHLKSHLRRHFDFIVAAYHDPATGGWRYSLDDSGGILDDSNDLYTLSFVIFSFSHYFRATGDIRATDFARRTFDMIDTKFRLSGLSGLAEALDARLSVIPRMRRQNPHMHLLEACLFAASTWNDPAYTRMADEMVALFFEFFYRNGALHEFFTDNLKPHPEKGNEVEPGHYFEWVWLLKKHGVLKGNPSLHDETCMKLLVWANKYGWDDKFGGIYDVLSPEGKVLKDTKRIWPFAEGLKANALMLDSAPDRDEIKDVMARMIHIFQTKYIAERGFWTEWLNRDLTPAVDYMPGTTPYHVYFGITETREVIHARGRTMSLTSGIDFAAYGLRRRMSDSIRALKKIIRR